MRLARPQGTYFSMLHLLKGSAEESSARLRRAVSRFVARFKEVSWKNPKR